MSNRLRTTEHAQTMAEYAVVLAVISIAIMLTLTSLGSLVAGRIQAITAVL